ncbi:FtsX-like permease family protein [Agaribacter marinus]|uniref:ABC transporter permease n=1 Tax=Virgibacillus salarius TaxID=447199 RepID=A0A941IBI4_9BACI|nr:ABC transporter permease [Virgibacillus salarius]MBR7795270.1 ABC transporter permease [Virgibacillus salarius]NAZ07985.1 FtsX-like permease family protein [Agaribacter marinus]
MTFRQFAFNNVKRNTRTYLSYFLSCMFAVIVFFMYAVVIFHPKIEKYDFRDIVKSGIIVSEVFIYLFSFLFVLYSTTSFIKSRKKEYGLLTTLGISKSQLNRLLITENTIIGLASIITGIIIGALLTKLFLMIFSAILGTGEILPFYLSWKAIGITVALFFIMFELNSIAVVWSLRTKSIMEVFRGTKTPKEKPRFSWILSLLALTAIGYSYYLAYTSDMISILYRMFIILALIIPGTYFLFTQFIIGFTTVLRRRKKYLYKDLNLLMISDLTYKLKDHARLLFIVTILSAVAFTSSGVLFGLFQSVEEESERFAPQDVTLISGGEENHEAFEANVAEIESAFQQNYVPFEALTVYPTRLYSISTIDKWNDTPFIVYKYSDYKAMLQLNDREVPSKLKDNEGLILIQDIIRSYTMDFPEKLTFKSANERTELSVSTIDSDLNSTVYSSFQLIVSDHTFEQFIQHATADEKFFYYVMDIPNWVHHVDTIMDILPYTTTDEIYPDSQAEIYSSMKDSMSYLFFFGIFISVLFFLAAGSILYFRMYQDIDNDLSHYHSLYRIGLTNKEMKKIATRQLGFLFFLPFIIAVIHAGFAFKALQNMLVSSVMVPSIYIFLLYFVIHFFNFIFIRNIYTSKLKKVM